MPQLFLVGFNPRLQPCCLRVMWENANIALCGVSAEITLPRLMLFYDTTYKCERLFVRSYRFWFGVLR